MNFSALQCEEMDRRLRRHYEFWRERHDGEGAYIGVIAPDETVMGKLPPVTVPDTVQEKWFNLEYRLKTYRYRVHTTYFAGDAVPSVFVDFGSGLLAAFLGAEYRVDEETIWFDMNPFIKNWQTLPELKLDIEGKLFKLVTEAVRRICEDSAGRYMVGCIDIGANFDVLASLRSREMLLRDLIREPEMVEAMIRKIDRHWMDVYDRIYSITREYLPGISSFTPLCHKKRWYKLMSEFSVMISPAMFRNFVCPALQREANHLDQAVFNLDGAEQVKHLPLVLELDGIHAVEWNPVPKFAKAQNCVFKDFVSAPSMEVYRQIQHAGKKLVINGIRPEQVEPVLNQISPDGVFLFVHCDSRKTADEFLAYAAKWRGRSSQ